MDSLIPVGQHDAPWTFGELIITLSSRNGESNLNLILPYHYHYHDGTVTNSFDLRARPPGQQRPQLE